MCIWTAVMYTVDPVINDPAINDLLSPTTFFSCTEQFSIVNDLWSTTFCLTRLATSDIWQKVIILLVSNDLNFFHHTTFGNNHEQTTACQIWLCGYHGYQKGITLEDQAVVARGLSTSDSAVTAQQYHLAPVGNHSTLHVQWSTKDMPYESI